MVLNGGQEYALNGPEEDKSMLSMILKDDSIMLSITAVKSESEDSTILDWSCQVLQQEPTAMVL